MFIKLILIKEIVGEEIGTILIDPDCIESIEEYNSPLMKGSTVTMKAVINGGNEDELYLMQTEHCVLESIETITALIEEYVKK